MSSKISGKLLSTLGLTSPLLVVGAAWDTVLKPGLWNKLVAKQEMDVDVDLSCVVFNAEQERLDTAWYANLKAMGGAIRHGGDDTDGDEEGDDESLVIDFAQLPEEAAHMFLVLSCFGKDSFAKLDMCELHLIDAKTRQTVWALPVAVGRAQNAYIALHAYRVGGDWQFNPVALPAEGQNIQGIYMELRQFLQNT